MKINIKLSHLLAGSIQRNLSLIITGLLCLTMALNPFMCRSQNFSNVAGTVGVNTSGDKEAGLCWADFNNDGFLDHVVNTNDTNNSLIYFSNAGSSFTNVTTTHAEALDDTQKNRSVVAADFNNDGYMDFATCGPFLLEIWLNNGLSGTPAYSFGGISQSPNQTISSLTGGLNAEGLLTIDYDNDGDLDLIVDNHAFGVDILSNNGSGQFIQVDNAITGLPTSSGNGDFAGAGDFNNDGFVDFCVRRSANQDIYLNDGDGTFSANAFDQIASNGNKGGIAWGDLDSDGDLDMVWTDSGTNQIWRNDSGVFTATGEPTASSGVDMSAATIDGCTIADVDNDGDLDMFFANVHTESYLFLNQVPGTLTFSRPTAPVNLNINPGGNAEGASFIDFDNDGDMDLSLNMGSQNNQLWANDQNDANFLRVIANWDQGSGLASMANGATAALFDCNNNRISPLMSLAAGESQGCFGVPVFHFGGVDPNQTYFVRVYFPFRNGVRSIVTKEVVPGLEVNQTTTILNSDASDVLNCPSIPVALDDDFYVLTGDQLYGNVTSNDTGNPVLVYALVDGGTAVTNGSLVFNASGSFEYATNLAAGAVVNFTYSICNSNGCDTASVSISIFDEGDPVCANPGVDGSANVSANINTYFPVAKPTNVTVGATNFVLSAVSAPDGFGNSFGTEPIAPGDLVMIVQMQNASFNTANSNLYGANSATVGPDGLGGSGYTNILNAGVYEFVVATNNVPITGGNFTFSGGGPNGGLVHSYVCASGTSTTSERTFQVIRVPQFNNLTLASNLVCPPWNGNGGGILVFDVAGTMDLNGFEIDASARGFRGGYQELQGSGANDNSVYSSTNLALASGKGEGVAGTPRFMWNGFTGLDNGVSWNGIAGGDFGRGAPANGGGGGADHNAGGGGGGNGNYGGNGGTGWEGGGGTLGNGGRPGAALPNEVGRVYLGGGGGGGDANNATSGVKGGVGGGIVMINASTLTGSGSIISNGSVGEPGAFGTAPDGAGGGGAGGTIFINVVNQSPLANLSLVANGGNGGNTLFDLGLEHGPGGGGGGGYIFYNINGATITTSVTGGSAGRANNGNGIEHGATYGLTGSVNPFALTDLPANLQGSSSNCFDFPIAINETDTISEDTIANGSVAGNDTDPSGDLLTWSVINQPANGSVIMDANGDYTYTPDVNFTGNDTIQYFVCDNSLAALCAEGQLIITVIPVNDPPVAADDNQTINEDAIAIGTVATGDLDAEDASLDYTYISGVLNGVITINADGSYEYIPNVNFYGTESIVYEVCDSEGLCDTGLLTITVLPVNDPPLAQDDNESVDSGTILNSSVAGNDNDPDDNDLVFSLLGTALNGTIVMNADGSYTYEPNVSFLGSETLTYQVCDTSGLCDQGVLIIEVIIADSDGDGITNADEILLGSDPTDSCDPNINALATNDCDNDGLDNAGEITAGTDNTLSDTDGDGINDGDEVVLGSDPLEACSPNPIAIATLDCDNDGLDSVEETNVGTDPIDADSDDDGMNDGDEVTNGSDPLDACDPSVNALATNDCDNDGLDNAGETTAGTDNTNPDTDNDGVNDGDEVTNGSDPLDACDPIVNALATNDCDNDGLDNAGETTAGTDNTNPDTDNDGINDGVEVTNGSDPLDACDPNVNALATNDCDNDGLDNAGETTAGTDNTNPDTDNDGVNDGDEVTNGFDPLDACDPNVNALATNDCDDDGLDNAGETTAGTDNTNPDTDNDGINDGDEVTNGSDPLNPCDPTALLGNDCGVPLAFDDFVNTGLNTAITIDVLDNDDFGFDGPSVGTITIINVADGTAIVQDNGTPNDPTDDLIEFIPGLDFEGLAIVEYEICDGDGDCATAIVGIEVGDCLSDLNADCDLDGFNNDDELAGGSDPLNPCDPDINALGTNDCDNDGLTNDEELAEGTDNTLSDTDNDGISDGNEVDAVTDPLDACDPNINALTTSDCDNDGLNNAGEITAGTDNTNPDTDNDGINDGDEVTNGSDPLDACDPNVNALATNDCDNDGLDNAGETTAGTDNTNPDTDGDTINDGDEVTNGSDPLDTCDPNVNALATNDCDNDGLDNAGEITAGTDNTNPDTDGDGLNDGAEVTGGTNPLDPCDPNAFAITTNDCDNDGLTNGEEQLGGDGIAASGDETNPSDADSDDDGLNDGEEVTGIDDVSTTATATGASDPLNPCDPNINALVTNDCDNDGLDNAGEITVGTDNTNPDTDGDGLNDGAEVTGGTNPLDPCDPNAFAITTNDCDNDGLTNGEEQLGGDGIAASGDETNPSDADSDDDGLNDGEEVTGIDDVSTVAITTGASDPLDACDPNINALTTSDCDNDGLDNAGEITAGTDNTNPDTDGDGLNDGAEVTGGTNPLDPCDPNAFAITTNDCDNDGLTNGEEQLGGDGIADSGDETNPSDADSDDDGLNDGEEVTGIDDVRTVAITTGASDPLDACDPNINALTTSDCDNDGLDNAGEITAGTDNTNPDTDGDGLNDGDEVTGGTNPLDPCDPNAFAITTNDCDNDGLTNGEEQLGGDGIAATGDETNPSDADSDDDGLNDGEEVTGIDDVSTVAITTGASDPLNPCDPNINALVTNDCDNDGLDNAGEITAGTDNTNPDTDGDGLNDGAEVTGGTNPLDPCDPNAFAIITNDCDNDGLTNGEEQLGGDGIAATGDETNPTDADSDDDGLNDGEEVTGIDDVSTAATATGASDPLNPCDPNINALVTNDCDNDGLDNAGEITAGTDNTNPDTDGDGLNDGAEVTGGTNPLDPCDPNAFAITTNDCDNDGLTNGEEQLGGDGIAATGDETNPSDADSDDDGLNDGEEVTGIDDVSTDLVASGESDPLNPCDPNATTSNPLCDLDDTYSIEEDEVLNGTVVDVSGLTYVVVDGPDQGLLILNADGTFTYQPESNSSGVVVIVYNACDENGICDTSTLTITIDPINDTPDAVFDTYSTDINTDLSNDVTLNDTDPDGDALTVTLVETTTNGTLSLLGDGSFTYDPNTNFTGEDVFVYSLCDPFGLCDTATVTIVVIDPNTLPNVQDDNFETDEDTSLSGNVLTNDSDVDGDALNATLLSDVTNGVLVLNLDGTFTYTPDADYFGPDSFVYVACDGNGGCVEATVFIVVLPINDAPVALDDQYNGEEDDTISADVSLNDTDVDDSELTYTVTSDPANGVVVMNEDGSFSYSPNADFFGSDAFEYQVCDTSNVCDTAIVTIFIDGLNDIPVAVDDVYTMDENTVLSEDVSNNDFDTDGSNPVWTIEGLPANGNVVLTDNGSFTYTPNADFIGEDSFTYILCDGEGDCDTATVVITVLEVLLDPIAVDDNAVVNEDSVLLYDASDNDSDPDGDELTYTILDGIETDEGTLTMDENGVITYIPPADFNGTVDFTYIACDNTNLCDTATVTIVVLPINDPPVGVNDEYTINQDTTLDNDVSENDNDVDDTNLVFDAITDVSNGTLTFNPDGTFTYVPNAGYYGVDGFTYTVCDGEDCDTVTVVINVIEVIIVPELGNDEYSTSEDVAVSGDASSNDVATDGFIYSVESGPSNGTVTMNPDGTFTYTPNAGFVGTDSFTYTACNEEGECLEAVVTIIVYNVVDPTDKVIAIPAGFSPNGDNVGDTFIIENIDMYPKNELIMFNRWGNIVYNAAPYTNSEAWDGTTESNGVVVGSKVPEGTYFYVLDKGDGSEKMSGFIVIKYELK